jgi:hypothetical protein
MHASVVHANIRDRAEAERGLDEQILPSLKDAPGFVGAFFVALDDTHGLTVQVFDTEAQARAIAPPVGADGPGVTVDTLQFAEVIRVA